jgi:hypothetical protein
MRWTGWLLGTWVVASCGGKTLQSSHDADGQTDDATLASDAGNPAQTLRVGLAASWAFDGNGADHGGKGLDLGFDGISFATGRFGKGLQFLGEGKPIAQRPISDPSLDLAAGDFTVSFWISFTETGSPQFAVVKGYSEGGWFVGWAQTVWAFGLPSPAGATFGSPGGSPSTGVFHHVVFEFSGTTAEIFVDGASVGTKTVADRGAPGPAPLQVGGYSPGGVTAATGQKVVSGVVDELAIWHRALDGTERAYLGANPVP